MMAQIHKTPGPLVFGVVEPKPLRDFPPGRARIRIRTQDWATVFIRPPEGGVRRFYVSEVNGAWVPALESGANRVVARGVVVATCKHPTIAPRRPWADSPTLTIKAVLTCQHCFQRRVVVVEGAEKEDGEWRWAHLTSTIRELWDNAERGYDVDG